MHALIVVAHPKAESLTHSVAARLAQGVTLADPDNTFEIADLAAEAFDPRFTATDIALHLREVPPPADILAEQTRIDQADALALVFPVYWWSMPGLLKGWIDRVFANGWAYDDNPETGLVKKLQHLKVHLVAIGGADMRTYARHGYFGAMKTQIEHGIFDYCGAQVVTSEILFDSHVPDSTSGLDTAQAVGHRLFTASKPCETTDAA